MENTFVKSIQEPSDVEVVEVKLLVPKLVMDRFNDESLFDIPKNVEPYSLSVRLSKYLLHYHKLLTRAEARVLNCFLNLPEVTKAFKQYDTGKITTLNEVNNIIGGK